MIVVERAVRPVRASMSRKRKMREELLGHVVGVFEEEAARLGDDRAALERTALRFGNPAEVTSELQESVPASDGIERFWEGRPGEPTWRTAFRFAWVSGAVALVLAVFFLVVAFLFVGWVSAWPCEAFILLFYPVLALPVFLAGLIFLTDWMEKALYAPTGRSWIKFALSAAGSWLFMLLWFAGVTWPADWDHWDWDHWLLIMGCAVVGAPGFTYGLAQSSIGRKRYDAEWARLDIA
jgi:ATP-dependent Clp protease ATP-binding subunit ClpC